MDDDSLFNFWLDRIPEMGKRKGSRRQSVQSLDIPINFMRKRKRQQDEDSVSIASIDSIDSMDGDSQNALNTSTTSNKSKKRRNSILRMSNSLVNLLSPVKIKCKVQRTSSLRHRDSMPSTPKCSTPAYKPPGPTPTKRRATTTWTDSMASKRQVHHLSQQLIKHQETIYELYQGEKDITSDLINLKRTYRESMVTLKLFTPTEANTIFGPIDELIPVHEDLARRLKQQQQTDGTTQSIGQQILDWVPQLKVYVTFCGNQLWAKRLLDQRQGNQEVEEFLNCCQQLPHSRKLDLWALLDGCRQRFMKYPLLIKAIQKETPEDHEDVALLHSALFKLDEIIAEADRKTGLSDCQFHKSQLHYTSEKQKIPEIEESSLVVCMGTLKNTKGNKLQVYLFDKAAVVTRSIAQGQQLLQMPIPISQLVVEDLADGEVRTGSFRNVVSFGQPTGKSLFRISFKDRKQGRSHTLMAKDEHSKQKWMQSFKSLTCHIIHKGPTTSDKV